MSLSVQSAKPQAEAYSNPFLLSERLHISQHSPPYRKSRRLPPTATFGTIDLFTSSLFIHLLFNPFSHILPVSDTNSSKSSIMDSKQALLKRNPSTSPEEFSANWLRHGALAAPWFLSYGYSYYAQVVLSASLTTARLTISDPRTSPISKPKPSE